MTASNRSLGTHDNDHKHWTKKQKTQPARHSQFREVRSAHTAALVKASSIESNNRTTFIIIACKDEQLGL
jgi:hypothetical protein